MGEYFAEQDFPLRTIWLPLAALLYTSIRVFFANCLRVATSLASTSWLRLKGLYSRAIPAAGTVTSAAGADVFLVRGVSRLNCRIL